MSLWKPISELPDDIGKEMFVVRAFNVVNTLDGPKYTSDPYCVFKRSDVFVRWPHSFPPTHFLRLPKLNDEALALV